MDSDRPQVSFLSDSQKHTLQLNKTDIFRIIEINLIAQSKSTWRDFMYLVFLVKLTLSFFFSGALLKIILFCYLNIIFLVCCEVLTGSFCCIVTLLTHNNPTGTSDILQRSFGCYFLLHESRFLFFIYPTSHPQRWTQVNLFIHLLHMLSSSVVWYTDSRKGLQCSTIKSGVILCFISTGTFKNDCFNKRCISWLVAMCNSWAVSVFVRCLQA